LEFKLSLKALVLITKNKYHYQLSSSVRKLLDLTNGNSKRQPLQLLAALTQNDTAGTYGYPLNIHRLQTENNIKRYLYSTELALDTNANRTHETLNQKAAVGILPLSI